MSTSTGDEPEPIIVYSADDRTDAERVAADLDVAADGSCTCRDPACDRYHSSGTWAERLAADPYRCPCGCGGRDPETAPVPPEMR